MTSSTQGAALLLAAGSGERMSPVSGGKNKVFLEIKEKPLFLYPLRRLLANPYVERVVVVYRPEDLPLLKSVLEREKLDAEVECVEGGPERFDSVYNGLSHLSNKAPTLILIQDSARIFLTDRMIREALEAAEQHGAATVAVPVSDTIKRREGAFLVETLRRENLYRIQTPQAFLFEHIWNAHQEFRDNPDPSVTDDCMLLERKGFPIALVPGKEENIKVTTPFDLQLAEVLLRRNPDLLSCS